MSALLSRVAIIAAGLPIVIGAAVVGGWFLLILVLAASLVALHEFYRLARELRPLVLAGYGGAIGVLLGAELGGPAWMIAGFLVTLPLAFVFAAISDTRQSTTVAVATTVFGAAWIGFGLAHLVLLRDLTRTAPRRSSPSCSRCSRPTRSPTSADASPGGTACRRSSRPGKTWEGFVTGAVAGVITSFLVLYETEYNGWRSIAFGVAVVLAATIGDLFESLVKRDLGAKDTGRVLLGHGGVLDRVDSLLFAAPAGFYVLLAFLS